MLCKCQRQSKRYIKDIDISKTENDLLGTSVSDENCKKAEQQQTKIKYSKRQNILIDVFSRHSKRDTWFLDPANHMFA